MSTKTNKTINRERADTSHRSIPAKGKLTGDQFMTAMWDLVIQDWIAQGKDPKDLKMDRSIGVLRRREF